MKLTMENLNSITQLQSILTLCNSDNFVDEFVKVYIPLYKDLKNSFIEFSKVHKSHLTEKLLNSISVIIHTITQSADLLDYIIQIYENPKDKKVDTIEQIKKVDTIEQSKKVDTIEQSKKVDTIEQIKKVDTIEQIKKVDTIEQIKKVNNHVLTGYPLGSQIGNFEDLIEKLDKILKANPSSKDSLYNICCNQVDDVPTYKRDRNIQACDKQADKTYISGSYALEKFIASLLKYTNKSNNLKENITKWKSNDIDVYILDSPQDFHYKIDKVDMVMSKKPDISQLLLSFDLPVNRVAIDKDDNFIISAECIRAIYTGKYYLPMQLASKNEATLYISRLPEIKETIDEVYGNLSRQVYGTLLNKVHYTDIIRSKVMKHHNRVEKYAKRGFTAEYVSRVKEHILFTPEYYDRASNY